MHSLTRLSLREQMDSLIKQLGFTEGYTPRGWEPKTPTEIEIIKKIDGIAKQLDQ